jgi:hypothetical protein
MSHEVRLVTQHAKVYMAYHERKFIFGNVHVCFKSLVPCKSIYLSVTNLESIVPSNMDIYLSILHVFGRTKAYTDIGALR